MLTAVESDVVRDCKRCQLPKPHGLRTRRGRRSAQPYCRDCMVAYHSAWRATETGHAKLQRKHAETRARYPDRKRARDLAYAAIRRGELVPGPCERAGTDCRGGIEAHHADYDKPLEVRWVCRRHHRALDRERQATAAVLQDSRPQTQDDR